MSLRGFGSSIRDALPLFDGMKLRRRKDRPVANSPEGARHRSFGSMFSFADSTKTNGGDATGSDRVTKRERKRVRAQDIFFADAAATCANTTVLQPEDAQAAEIYRSDPDNTSTHLDDYKRSSTPITPIVLKKALLPITGPQDDKKVESSRLGENPDVSVPEFEGYLDILSYLQRDLPAKPTRARSTPSPPMVPVTLKTPKEEEWMSCRSPSQSSISNRSRSAAGGLSRTNSNTKTVTPMSSVDSDSELRLHAKQPIPPLPEPRIEEVSEPETTSPHKTPKRSNTATPSKCFHCGRDPCGPDPEYTNSSVVTVLKAFKQEDAWSEPETEKKAAGPSIQVEDARGHRYLLYPQTSFYQAVEETQDDEDDAVPAGFQGGHDHAHIIGSTALESARQDVAYILSGDHTGEEVEDQNQTRFWEYDDEDDEDLCTPTVPPDPYERPFNPDPYSFLETPSSAQLLPEHDDEDDNESTDLEGEIAPTFWKDPDGVIVVYKGIEVNGRQTFYGGDINYLGSFYDDEEDSSGLGSSHHSPVDSVGSSIGLWMIPEVPLSEDEWDEGAFD